MRIAIDGPAGSGKSTVAKALARKCGLVYLDTGAMYRACALRAIREGVDFDDTEALAACAKAADIAFGPFGDQTQVFLDGVDVSADVRTPEIDKAVSVVAGIPAIREDMVARQRQMGAVGDVVAEGRDIGSVVFPDAEVKVFLVADPAARAHRRAVQRAGGDVAKGKAAEVDPANEQAILKDIERRDAVDSSRDSFKLEPSEGAVTIDSSDLTVDEVVDRIAALMDKARAPKETPSEPSGKAGSSSGKASKERGRMRAFAHNAVTDYYEHPMREFPLPARLFLGLAMNLVWVYTKILFPWKVEEPQKLLDGKGAARGRVIVMNHVSMLDPVVLAVYLYHHGIRIRPVSKSEFDKIPLVSWAFSRFGCIPVVRGTADIKAIRRAQRALQAGDWVLVFPEGTRVKSDDEPSKIHGGFALIAQMAKADVQPMAIVGARDITPRGKHLPRPSRVWLKAGDPISFDDLAAAKRKAQIAEMEQVSMERVFELRDELRAEHPGKM